ncbi:hypothetical protein LEN26_015841 [Aphanomyces euteiches]|nr:hypothetical protein LEN26_015841 [Aphanomyces euteiches]KAH9112169.1 hypothetical protein AeMF1_013463 [Aphanomyces euteiches]KAH9183109.1 hypothetical protein AeNC1_014913 [Aphanomyces euteiches]
MRLVAALAVLLAVATALLTNSSQCKSNELYCENNAGTAGLCYVPRDRWDCCNGLLHYMGPGALDECCFNPTLNLTYLANISSGGCQEYKRTPEPLPAPVPTATVSSASSSTGMSTGAWIGIIAVVVVIAIAVAVTVMKKKQRASSVTEITIMESKDQRKMSKEYIVAE